MSTLVIELDIAQYIVNELYKINYVGEDMLPGIMKIEEPLISKFVQVGAVNIEAASLRQEVFQLTVSTHTCTKHKPVDV